MKFSKDFWQNIFGMTPDANQPKNWITRAVYIKTLKDIGFKTSNIEANDDMYKAFSYAELAVEIKNWPKMFTTEFRLNLQDCDDYTLQLRAFVLRKYPGLAISETIWTNGINKHAVVLIMTTDNGPFVIEPQNSGSILTKLIPLADWIAVRGWTPYKQWG